jgi:hypothetical protein
LLVWKSRVVTLATMLNNHHTHFSQNVFERQSHTPNSQQLRRNVRQDKPHPPRARIASLQPAPHKNIMRPHHVNNNPFRSQNRPIPKRKTVHLTLWVKPVVKAELERIAEREGLSVSATGAAFLEQALQQNIDLQYSALLQPIIEQAIRKHMRSYSSRIAVLLVRSLFESSQTRSLATNILGRHPGVTQPILEEILNGSSHAAKRNITRITPQLADLLKEVEQWMEEGENTHA